MASASAAHRSLTADAGAPAEEHWVWLMFRMAFRAVLALEVAALVVVVVVLSSAFGAYRAVLPVIPEPRDIELYQPKTATVLYDVHGAEIARVFEEDRELVDLDDIPAVVQNATIAIEDKRFYQHQGVDPVRMVRVILLEMESGGQSQGASTITMQLAREIYLSKTKLFGRKVQELGLAINIERVFSKREILEMYLNQVCYGDGAYGIKAAARRFYQKDLCELELHEAALLVGLPNNPEGLSPYDHPDAAKQRRNHILSEMAAQGYVSRDEAESAKARDLGVKPRSVRGLLSFKHPYFTEYAVQELIARFGKERVYGGGLRVYTTLDPELQQRAQEILTAGVNRHRGARVRQGAAVLLAPESGHILALVGGTGWSQEDQYNRAVLAERQPGSSMKPFVWTTALEFGFTPDTTVPGSACAFDVGGGLVWAPRNCGGGGGSYTLASGLQNSVNIVSARLTMSVGPEAVVRTAKKMGIRSNIRPFPSIALGTEGVTPLDMATAYCCFANGGYRVRATTIDKIYDHNHVLLDAGEPEMTQVLSRRIAYEMNQMMQRVIRAGTGTRAQGLNAPTAGKTGTTDLSCDAWFVGVTPKMSCAVWVGNDENDPMGGVFGGNVPCPIWREIMGVALPLTGREGGEFPGPGYDPPLKRGANVKLVVGKALPSTETSESTGGGGGGAGRGRPADLFN